METLKEIVNVISGYLRVEPEKVIASSNLYEDFDFSDEDEDIMCGILSSRFGTKVFLDKNVFKMSEDIESLTKKV